MRKCSGCGKSIPETAIKCRYCRTEHIPHIADEIIVSTAGSIDGYEVIENHGFVCGEVVCPNGLFGAITNGTFFTFQALADARSRALEAVKNSAKTKGANAIIGLDIDISDLNGNGILVSANATAVYVMSENYDRLTAIRTEEAKKEEERKRLEQEKKQEELSQRLKKYECISDYLRVCSVYEKVIINAITTDGETNPRTVLSRMSRATATEDVLQAFNSLEEKKLIAKNQSGNYVFDEEDE